MTSRDSVTCALCGRLRLRMLRLRWRRVAGFVDGQSRHPSSQLRTTRVRCRACRSVRGGPCAWRSQRSDVDSLLAPCLLVGGVRGPEPGVRPGCTLLARTPLDSGTRIAERRKPQPSRRSQCLANSLDVVKASVASSFARETQDEPAVQGFSTAALALARSTR